ncbi:hypothetical protein Tco_1125499 [Tanacetum coccineum]|uniref:Uncharacterized protein n=1 Tax=Tanacetum coccineum TaxID=301880 RepID=A0ABQ5J948_9ASTR
MSVKYPTYVNLTSSSEEQPNERTPSPPPRKKSLSPPQAPSKSISSKSTHYTSSSSPSSRKPSFVVEVHMGLILVNSSSVLRGGLIILIIVSSRRVDKGWTRSETDFESWQQRIVVLSGLDNGENIMGNRLLEDGNSCTIILLQGIPKDIYTLINHFTDAKDIWVISLNDMRNIKMTMSRMQLNSKFVNNMLPEWSRFITEVKLNRGLKESNFDQLYAYLKAHLSSRCRVVVQGNVGGQNRVGNMNPGQAKPIMCYKLLKGIRPNSKRMSTTKRPREQLCLVQENSTRDASDVQHNYVVDFDADYTSDSNIIPYDQYVEDNEEHVVQSNVSSVQNDALMSILDEMHEQGGPSMSANKQCAEIEKKNLLIENENLIVNCLSTQLLYDVEKSRCLDLEADMSKVHDELKHISKLERENINLQLKYQHLQESFDNKKSQASQEAPDFLIITSKIWNLEHQIQEKDNVIRDLKVLVSNVNERSCEPYNANDVTALIEQNECVRVELEEVKQHYKELFESIHITRASTNEKTSSLLTQIEDLKAQLEGNLKVAARSSVKTKVLAPEYVIGTCPKEFTERDSKAPSIPLTRKKQVTFNNNAQKHGVHQKVQQSNVQVPVNVLLFGNQRNPTTNWGSEFQTSIRLFYSAGGTIIFTWYLDSGCSKLDLEEEMAPVRISSGPEPKMMFGQNSSSLVLHQMTSAQISSGNQFRPRFSIKGNLLLDLQKLQMNPIFRISVDIFVRAFTTSANVPSIYIQLFWNTLTHDAKTGRSLLHDNIVPKPDLALELGKSISLTEVEEEAIAREVHATHARIVSESELEPTQTRQSGIAFRDSFIVSKKRSSDSSKKFKGIQTLTPAKQEAADIMKALKESKKMSKRQARTGGSNEGTGNILGVPDESTVVSRASSEGTGSKPGVPDEEKLILE